MGDKVFKLKNLNDLWNIIVSALNSKSNSGHIHNDISAIDITGQTVDVNTYNLSAGSPFTQLYIEKTSGGASNITNIPVTGQPFRLFVDLVRWASTSDYITRQTFVSIGTKSTYERWCTNGTWTSWMPVSRFTATPASGQVLVSDGTAGGVKTSGFTIGKSVPADAKFTDTTYTHPTTAGNKHIPSGGSSGQILRWSADGTAAWGADNNTTYGAATQSANGLMPASDKKKLDYTNVVYGTCSTDAATAAKVVEISGNTSWKLEKGAVLICKFSNTNTASNVTLNVSGSGAKSIWYNTSVYTGTSNQICGCANRTYVYVYDGTYWVWVSAGVDANSTYSPATLGQGYGTCTTAAATAAKVVTLSGYVLVTGGIVAVKFTYDVPANATMNINSKGAKSIYYRGAAITAGIIKAGDVGLFIYNGSQYHLISVDRDENTTISETDMKSLFKNVFTKTT